LNATARGFAARRVALSLALATAMGGATRMLHAAATPFAAPVQQAAPSTAGGLLRVIVALLVVLAAVLAAAWLARRMRRFSGGGSTSNLELLAQLPLGPRERAVLLRVGECQLLIGVAPGSVRTLHVLERSSSPMSAEATPGDMPVSEGASRPSFKALLLKSLGK
jgi:flagellar protein FliO/FliZ